MLQNAPSCSVSQYSVKLNNEGLFIPDPLLLNLLVISGAIEQWIKPANTVIYCFCCTHRSLCKTCKLFSFLQI